MNIAQTQFTMNTGSFEIYLSGCRHRCTEHCHNRELWDFMIGDPYNEDYFNKIKEKISDDFVETVSILGGEPLDQNPQQFIKFLEDLSSLNKPIWLYTSYTKIDNKDVEDAVNKYVSVIKMGEFDELQKCDDNVQLGIKLATKNQHFKILK